MASSHVRNDFIDLKKECSMLAARTTIGSAPRTTLIWVRVRELGFKRRSLVLQDQWMRTLLHALRVVGSTSENDLNLRF